MFSIGYAGLDSIKVYIAENENGTQLQKCGVKTAQMINKAGKIVSPTLDSIRSAVRSKAGDLLFSGTCPGFGLCADISDASDDYAWPIAAMTVILLSCFPICI